MNPFLRQSLLQALVILALATIPAVVVVLVHPYGPTLQSAALEVTAQEVRSWRDPVLWVDARPQADFEAGHIEGAVPLNERDWEQQIDGFLDAWYPEARIVVYCGGGECNASRGVAERLAAEAGLGHLHILKGGYAAWLQSE